MTPGAARGLGPSSQNRETSACRFGSRDRRGAGGRRIDAAARLPPQPVALLQAVRAFRSARAVANGTRRRGDSVLRGDSELPRAECFAAEGGLSVGNAAEQRLHTTRHGGHSSCPPRPHSISLSSRYTVHCEHRHRIVPSPSILDRGVPAMPSSWRTWAGRPRCVVRFRRNSSLRTLRAASVRRETQTRRVTCERHARWPGNAARVKRTTQVTWWTTMVVVIHSVLGVHGRAVRTCQLAPEAPPSPDRAFQDEPGAGENRGRRRPRTRDSAAHHHHPRARPPRPPLPALHPAPRASARSPHAEPAARHCTSVSPLRSWCRLRSPATPAREMAPHNLLSDSDSDDGSPAVRPTASRPKSKSAPPKSAKTEVQAGRSRAARAASDDGMDSDASDEPNDAALQAVMQQLTKQAFPCPRSALVRTPAQPPCATWAPTVSPSAPAEDDHAEEGRQEAAALGSGVRAHRWDSAQRPHQHA